MLAISRDVTEVRQAEQERATLYREALEREQRLQELVGTDAAGSRAGHCSVRLGRSSCSA